MFKVHSYAEEHYYILLELNNYYFGTDSDIANKLGIPIDEYKKIIIDFGSFLADNNCLYFPTHQQTQECCDYLTDRFGVMLKLME